jgi:hypothetical protein
MDLIVGVLGASLNNILLFFSVLKNHFILKKNDLHMSHFT